MADSTIRGLNGGTATAPTADSYFAHQQTSTATRAEPTTFALMGGLEIVHRDTDAVHAMVVGEHYIVDISAWSNSGNGRVWTLPTAANVGERIAITLETGDATEHLAITAATSDTLNGVAGGTEWSRLLITGETVVMKCVTADSIWVVEYDGRIGCRAAYHDDSFSHGNSDSWKNLDLSAATADITTLGITVDTTNDYFVVRRGGSYQFVTHTAESSGELVSGELLGARVQIHQGSSFGNVYTNNPQNVGAGSVMSAAQLGVVNLNAGDFIKSQHRTDATGPITDTAGITLTEIL